jgi:hypothetical protein
MREQQHGLDELVSFLTRCPPGTGPTTSGGNQPWRQILAGSRQPTSFPVRFWLSFSPPLVVARRGLTRRPRQSLRQHSR